MMTAPRDTCPQIAFAEVSGELRQFGEFTPENEAAIYPATASPGVSQPQMPHLALLRPNIGLGFGTRQDIQSP